MVKLRPHILPVLALLLALLLGNAPLWAQDYTVNLKDTDIQELIKFVAEVTDTTIVVDPAVKGKVKVVSTKPVSASELYELFLSILEVHGYTAVRSCNFVRVIPSKDARSSPVAVRDKGTGITSEEYVTQVIRLENISAAKLIPVLRPLVPQQAHMAAYAPVTRSSFPMFLPISTRSRASSTAWINPQCKQRISSRCASLWQRTW